MTTEMARAAVALYQQQVREQRQQLASFQTALRSRHPSLVSPDFPEHSIQPPDSVAGWSCHQNILNALNIFGSALVTLSFKALVAVTKKRMETSLFISVTCVCFEISCMLIKIKFRACFCCDVSAAKLWRRKLQPHQPVITGLNKYLPEEPKQPNQLGGRDQWAPSSPSWRAVPSLPSLAQGYGQRGPVRTF